MKLAEVSVTRPVAVSMVYLIVAVLGVFGLMRLRVDLFPDIDYPAITVASSYPGVGPEEMETLVTRPIEESVSRVEGVSKIESNSSEGRSRVVLSFEWGANLAVAFTDVQAALERAKARLPEDMTAPVIYKFDITNVPIMVIALRADMSEGALRRFADDVVKPRLERVEGVASADVAGARAREIRVAIDPAALASLAITPAQVVAAIRAESPTVPTGVVGDGREKIVVRALGDFTDLEQIRDALVTQRGSHPIRVRDLATVEDSFEDRANMVRVDGENAVSIRIIKTANANTIEVSDRLQQELAAFNEEMGETAQLVTVVDNSEFIRASVDSVQQGMLIGAALAVGVLLFFLRSLLSTLIVGVVIPIAILATMFMLEQLGLTLNLITFGGIALGTGMLVDNSIVILENIYRHREGGAGAREAAIRGSTEVASAIVASTLTTVVVFAPVVFLRGFVGIFFQQMALVVVCALLWSLAAALTLTPMLSGLLLARRSREPKRGPIGWLLDTLDAAYAWLLSGALRLGWLVVLVAIAALGLSLWQSEQIGREFFPESDESEVRITGEYPTGTRLEHTDLAARTMEAVVREQIPEARLVMTTVGSGGGMGGGGGSGEETVQLRVILDPVNARQRSSQAIATAIAAELGARLPGMRVSARAGGGLWIMNLIRGGEERVRVEVRGNDLATGDALAAKVAEEMAAVEGVSDARASRRPGGRELRIVFDRTKLADLGVTARELAETVSTLVLGTRAGLYREFGDEYDIKVRLDEPSLESIRTVLSAPVLVGDSSVLLSDLVSELPGTTPQAIERLNQDRIVNVSGGLDGSRDLASINADLRERLASIPVPESFSLRLAGEDEQQQQGFQTLGLGLLLAALLVYMVMAAQFESLVQPLVIMASVPFALIGVVISLRTTATTLNLYSFLGLIVLVGVVVNNAIVLVDYANGLRSHGGLALREAVITAGRRRLRPILMTTSTTVLALVPVAISSGTGAENQAPLARVVVGGLLSSTLITLFVVPILYYAVGLLQQRLFGPPKPSTPELAASPASSTPEGAER